MMRLVLVRHAKAVAKSKADRDRELAPDGRVQAERVGAFLAAQDIRPGLALVSPSIRTRETWELVAAGLGPVPARFEERIYSGDVGAHLDLLREQNGASLILVGHNPTIHELAFRLTAKGDRDALAPSVDFPTAGVAMIDVALATWRDLREGEGRLVSFTAPDAMG